MYSSVNFQTHIKSLNIATITDNTIKLNRQQQASSSIQYNGYVITGVSGLGGAVWNALEDVWAGRSD